MGRTLVILCRVFGLEIDLRRGAVECFVLLDPEATSSGTSGEGGEPMTGLTPEEQRFYADSPTTVLYDIFADAATRLGGRLVALARAAETDTDRGRWRQRMYEIEDQKEAVDPDDRDALVSHIEQWNAELSHL